MGIRQTDRAQQLLLFLIALMALPFSVAAQDDGANLYTGSEQAQNSELLIERLQYIQSVLSQKITRRSELGERIELANEQDKADLRRQADDISQDIHQLRATLAGIATGNVDTSPFAPVTEARQSSLQEDITMIAQPVIDSLKELTEKPRRLKELNEIIASSEAERDLAREALANLQPALDHQPQGALAASLKRIQKTWQGRKEDAENAIEIARFQIADLRGDKTLAETVIHSLLTFAKGRGLTIVLAMLAAVSVWLGVRFVLRGYRATLIKTSEPESRTRYRLAAYSVHALTGILVLAAVFVVFYQRGDVLLLGLLILLIVGLALSIRHLLPQYLREARLLLNIGPMREAERIIYRGIPWRVESINMTTILRNPELNGVLRVPLSQFHGLHSRPSGQDSWFPTSQGDVVLLPDDQLMEIIGQNPDTVELRERGGQLRSIPTTDFYSMNMVNLSRGGAFSVTEWFRVDYAQQTICTTDVPRILRSAIRQVLLRSDIEPFVKDVCVELQAAGQSSIDFWLFATMQAKAAKSYLRIKRLMQSACVQACSEQGWAIPYRHLAVVKKHNDSEPNGASPQLSLLRHGPAG